MFVNIFKAAVDAFDVVTLTDTINTMTYRPGLVSSMGLFSPTPVSVLTVSMEAKGDLLYWVPPSPRGGPGMTMDKNKRNLRAISIPHFQIDDSIMAEEVQGVRAYGTEDQLEVFSTKISERQGLAVNSMAYTEEAAMLGAIKGVVTYADASTLDLFNFFGVTQETPIDFDLDNANPADGVLRQLCMGIRRQLGGILDGIPFGGIVALCGDTFFDQLIKHPEVRETYKGWSDAAVLRTAYVGNGAGGSWAEFEIFGIRFINYRGTADVGIATGECHMFPTGVPNLFRSYYAPADYIETVNTMGQRLYSKMWEMPNGKGVNLEVQTNALHICQRPRVLLKGTNT